MSGSCPPPRVQTPTIPDYPRTHIPPMRSEYGILSSHPLSHVSPGTPSQTDCPWQSHPKRPPCLRRQRRSPHGSRHTVVIQEKLSVDGSTAHGTIAETNGSENDTHSEFGTLRRIPDSVPFSFSVVATEVAERFSYHGQFHSQLSVSLGPTLSNRAVPFLYRNRVSWLISESYLPPTY